MNLFLDLSKSLLDSQFQINKHEIFIRRNESLLMEDGVVCHLSNREIVRVSVTLLDFGSFQDRTIISQFLESMLRGRLDISSVVSDSEQEQISEMNEKFNKFRDQFKELGSLAPQTIDKPFYNCWFLSLPQLLIILDHVKTADDLQREIWKTRNFSASSLDFYMEYDWARYLYSKA
ncbi:MAG: hypothetical protein BJG00_016565 [Limnothrix sp. CACIAM 69d]|nr:MAG: hypothetical protein BJG00_016565 [Limnothrix sp. CACIAM 69d]